MKNIDGGALELMGKGLSIDNTQLGIVEATGRSLTIVTRFIPNGGTSVTDTRRLKPS